MIAGNLGHLPLVNDTVHQPCLHTINWIKVIYFYLFQAKDVIRSQFACTYKDDELPLNRVLEFPSTSQVPTCVHPAPKTIHAVDKECSSGVEVTTTGTDLNYILSNPTDVFHCMCRKAQNVNTSSAAFSFCWDRSVSSYATQLD